MSYGDYGVGRGRERRWDRDRSLLCVKTIVGVLRDVGDGWTEGGSGVDVNDFRSVFRFGCAPAGQVDLIGHWDS